jgi:hypothetical protein
MKKKIENVANSLADELLANSGVVPATVPQNGGGNKTEAQQSFTDVSWTHFTVICSSELVDKIKAIAQKEGFTIREVVEKSFRDTINKYESKHGPIVIKSKKKQNVEDVL